MKIRYVDQPPGDPGRPDDTNEGAPDATDRAGGRQPLGAPDDPTRPLTAADDPAHPLTARPDDPASAAAPPLGEDPNAMPAAIPSAARASSFANVAAVPADVESLDAEAVLALALRTLGRDRVALASSLGVEDMVILDMLSRLERKPRVLTLDTGRLHQETYDVMDAARRRYGVEIEVYFPRTEPIELMVRAKGLNLMYESIANRRECCGLRKVEPLARALKTVDGWIPGLRRDQIATRAETPKIGVDEAHGGIWKIAPLADWTSDRVWEYVREHDVPYNALHDQGFPSIGCAPCTRAIEPGEDPRAGRWWWELPEHRECGLHFDPVSGKLMPQHREHTVEGIGAQASSF